MTAKLQGSDTALAALNLDSSDAITYVVTGTASGETGVSNITALAAATSVTTGIQATLAATAAELANLTTNNRKASSIVINAGC